LAHLDEFGQSPPNYSAATGLGRAGSRPLVIHVKRALDVTMAAFGLVFLAPLFAVIAAVLLLHDGSPVIYKHRRIGLGGRPFLCWKFRSMTRDSDRRLSEILDSSEAYRQQWQSNQKLDRDPRAHRVGTILRKSSLDELPQLINVLRGDMSIVGPRPIVPEEISRYGKHAPYYLALRPGITGLWQVSGRSDTRYSERVDLDVRYCRTWTIGGDIAIIAKTLLVLFSTRGSR
jgi:exopolysaccharide production protein ExoY